MKKLVNGLIEENPSSAHDPSNEKDKFILPPDEEAEKQIHIKGMTTDDLIDTIFQGIDLVTYNGDPFTRTFLVTSLNSAIETAEQMFDICIRPKVIEGEIHDYEGESIWNYQYTPLYKRPVQEIVEMKYKFGTSDLMTVPREWIQVDKIKGDVTIFPTSGSTQFIMPAMGAYVPFFMFRNYMPMGVEVTYKAGMEMKDIPVNLLEWIYKKASISVFEVWGDQIIGAGIASSSLSIDGLSQSIGTTQSAMYGGASARILEYRKDLDELTPIIRRHFARFDSVVL